MSNALPLHPDYSELLATGKMADLKTEVYRRCGISSTVELKNFSAEFLKLDFRFKANWKKVLTCLQDDLTISDLDRQEEQARVAHMTMGRLVGMGLSEIEKEWSDISTAEIDYDLIDAALGVAEADEDGRGRARDTATI
ncbi:MAG: hypothetical protein WA902_00895 [Thermosynechococcaceae cyanobacterium]